MEKGGPGAEPYLYLGVSFRCCRIVHGHIFSSPFVKRKEPEAFGRFKNERGLGTNCSLINNRSI